MLDIASGTGAQCRDAGKAGFDATGIDLAESMVNVARSMGGANTSYIEGSALALPFDDESFDICLLILALHEHPESERTTILKEALRVLQPRGHLVIAEYQEPKRAWKLHPAWQLIRGVEHAAGAAHRSGFRDFVSRGSLTGFVERHGLTSTEEVRSHFGMIRAVAIPRR